MRRVTQTLTIRTRVEGAPDWTGNPVVTWAESAWPVYAVAPRSSVEPGQENRDLVVTGVTVYAPVNGPRPGPLDRVTLDGGAWEVAGDVAVWDNNPHFATTRQHGIAVDLKRSEG